MQQRTNAETPGEGPEPSGVVVERVARSDGAEEWATGIDEVRGVDALKIPGNEGWAWHVTLAVAEFVREEPLQSELFGAVTLALRAVPGVQEVEHMDREVWIVDGDPAGESLVRAAAHVLDRFADRTRPLLEG
ncbi:MAG: hypothetical protein AB7N76_01615 [Planctomycetota bacterium]